MLPDRSRRMKHGETLTESLVCTSTAKLRGRNSECKASAVCRQSKSSARSIPKIFRTKKINEKHTRMEGRDDGRWTEIWHAAAIHSYSAQPFRILGSFRQRILSNGRWSHISSPPAPHTLTCQLGNSLSEFWQITIFTIHLS